MKRKTKKTGETTQKLWSFRIDHENETWLEKTSVEKNVAKGRLVNDLLAEARMKEPETVIDQVKKLKEAFNKLIDQLKDKGYFDPDEQPDTYTNYKDRQP